MILLELLWQFILIGMVAFGGGTAMIPLLQRTIVQDQAWLSLNEFINIIGLSQMTPGPIAVNAATFIGYLTSYQETNLISSAILGATLATTGVIIVPTLLMSFVLWFEKSEVIQNNIRKILFGLKPALVGLILASATTIGLTIEGNVIHLVLLVATLALLFKTKISPILMLLAGGLLGMVFF
jgi:chromate transporter